MALEGWNLIDEDRAILWREYSFSGNARATSLAFKGRDGMVVLSPAAHVEPRALDAIAEFGDVRALVATNALHHLGQKAWRARFPDAESFCPPGAVTTLQKKVAGIPFRPLGELELPAHARWEDTPGFKTGETILGVEGTKGSVYFTGDLLTNFGKIPPPMGWLFRLTDSAPGFKLFRMAVMLMAEDKAAIRDATLARFDAHPPVVIVPGHGRAVDSADVAERARAELRKL